MALRSRKPNAARLPRSLVEGPRRRLESSFARQFLRNPVAVGTLFRSGPFLAKRLTAEALRHKPATILEVGCGDGAITKTLAKGAAREGIRFLAVDINAALLSKNPVRGSLFQGDASRLPVRSADVIVCGLPLALLPKEKVLEILREFRRVAPNFVAFQYSTTSLKLIRQVFPNARVVTYVLANVPPAVVISGSAPAAR
ncbi:MAG TPA: methyltransferase domain-containing protein [Candidatus Thermoplasmatota archaeon]|nr:methyltransferase domain-containing protein [Candidatus Thermoplasmatota archaeon]